MLKLSDIDDVRATHFELAKMEQDYMEQAFKISNNMNDKYKLYQKARICRRIAEELVKWETTTRGY